MSLSLPLDLTIKPQQSDYIIGLAELMTRVFKGEDLSDIASALMARAQLDDANALFDLSILLQLQGNKETALALQQEALSQQQLFTLNPTKNSSTLKLLSICTTGDLMTNTPLEFIADGAGFHMQTLYIADHLPLPKKVPEHDIAIVAISELDRNLDCLPRVEHFISQLDSVVLNTPANIAQLSRDLVSQNLQNLAGIEVPITARASYEQLRRETLSEIAASLGATINYPIIIRPIDSHAGNQLEKVDCQLALMNYLTANPNPEFFIAPFVDYRSADGLYKKYRIMVIGGKPFIAHMAISEHWMIHYLNAGMIENAEKRFAEAQAMGHFEQGFALKHQTAFATLADEIGLEYFGIDCAETQDGKLLIFEACASLNVHAMDCEKTFPYKKVQMQKLFDAFLQMLEDKK
ncbi:MAG: hypothetical protein V7784_10495 [Oceanospirillaceae bacterium]